MLFLDQPNDNSLISEQAGLSSDTSDLYFGGAVFESRAAAEYCDEGFFVVFLGSHKCWDSTSNQATTASSHFLSSSSFSELTI
jgi:hypothetical protein